MIRALVWKEYREQRGLWLALLMISSVAMAVVMGAFRGVAERQAGLALVAALMTWVYGLTCGATLLAGEREKRTLPLLDQLAAYRTPVWILKASVGALGTMVQAMTLCGLIFAIVWFFDVQRADVYLAWTPMLLALLFVGLRGFAWGMWGSACVASALPAVLAALLPALIIEWGWFGLADRWPAGYGLANPVWSIGARFLAPLVGLVSSWLWFCGQDLTRAPEGDLAMAGLDRLSVMVLRAVPGTRQRHEAYPCRALLWLTIRQGRLAMALLVGFALAVGLAILLSGLGAAGAVAPAVANPVFVSARPIETVIMGFAAGGVATLVGAVLCGFGMFAGDQLWGAQRFLGDQRLPATRAWLVKLVVWLVPAAFIAMVMGIVAIIPHGAVLNRLRGTSGQLWSEAEGIIHLRLLFLSCLAYGFAIGQFAALASRKQAPAAMLALIASLVGFVWLPSILTGGLHLWQIVLPPIVLLVATRLAWWPWVSETLDGLRGVWLLLAFGVMASGTLVGAVAYRIVEAPAAPAPFDLAAYRPAHAQSTANAAGRLIREIEGQFRLPPAQNNVLLAEYANFWTMGNALAQVSGALQVSGGFVPFIWIPSRSQFNTLHETVDPGHWQETALDRAMERPWANEELARYLDRVFAERWARTIRALPGLPVGIVERPVSVRDVSPAVAQGTIGVVLLRARAVQLHANGDDLGALDRFAEALALCRDLEYGQAGQSYLQAKRAEFATLETVERWLNQLPRPLDPKILRRTVRILRRHDDELPPLSDPVKADYVAALGWLKAPEPLLNTPGLQYAGVALQAPWEQARQLRLLNAVFAGLLRAAELNYPEWLARFGNPARWDWTRNADWLERRLNWIPASDEGAARQGERLGEMVSQSWLPMTLPGPARLHYTRALCVLRAIALQSALALYQLEEGQPANRLEDLVPRYLPGVPIDPFSGRAFRYRLSPGEDIEIRTAVVQPPEYRVSAGGTRVRTMVSRPFDYRRVAPGQGVIWSAGPDGSDDGGVAETISVPGAEPRLSRARGTDWIYLVPVGSR